MYNKEAFEKELLRQLRQISAQYKLDLEINFVELQEQFDANLEIVLKTVPQPTKSYECLEKLRQ